MFSRLFKSKKSRPRRQTRRRPALQQLETRRLMAVDMPFPLPIPPAPPEPDPTDVEWIDLLSIPNEQSPHHGESNNSSALNDLAIVQMMDSPSTELFVQSVRPNANGAGIKFVTSSNDSSQQYFQLKLAEPRISGYSTTDDKPQEEIDLNFKGIEFKYNAPEGQNQGQNNNNQNNGGQNNGNEEEQGEGEDPVLGPGRGGLLGPGGVVDQNGQEANSNNNDDQPQGDDNPQNDNEDPVLGPGRGGLLGPGGVVDQNGQEANSNNNDDQPQGDDNPQSANEDPVTGSSGDGQQSSAGAADQNGAAADAEDDTDGESQEELAAWYDDLLRRLFSGEQIDDAQLAGQATPQRLGYFHGRLVAFIANPFALRFLGGGQSNWVRPNGDEQPRELPEILQNGLIADALNKATLGDYGLKDLNPEDFEAYTDGFEMGLKDTLRPAAPQVQTPRVPLF